MKLLSSIVAIVATVFTQTIFAQDSTTQNQAPELLPLYYAIKDALVSGNATAASQNAAEFVKTLNSADAKIITETLRTGLFVDAGKISKTTDLKKQRDYFSGFSADMIVLEKEATLSSQPIYQAYCPMKKAYWLSNSKGIKNPYFGSSMLTCGQVTQTLP